MKRPSEGIERRALKRVAVHTPAIAVVRAKPTLILGQIQDISLGGLSFTYIQNGRHFDETAELEVLLPRERYYLSGLSFTTISDAVIPKENPFSMITMNRRGIRFLYLTPLQTSQLRDLIQKVHKAVLTGPGISTATKRHKGFTTPAIIRHARKEKGLCFDLFR